VRSCKDLLRANGQSLGRNIRAKRSLFPLSDCFNRASYYLQIFSRAPSAPKL
jgi:hypothetical protein